MSSSSYSSPPTLSNPPAALPAPPFSYLRQCGQFISIAHSSSSANPSAPTITVLFLVLLIIITTPNTASTISPSSIC